MEEFNRATCFCCGHATVVWDADFNAEEYGYEKPGIVHECHCAHCGAEITYVEFEKDDSEPSENLEND